MSPRLTWRSEFERRRSREGGGFWCLWRHTGGLGWWWGGRRGGRGRLPLGPYTGRVAEFWALCAGLLTRRGLALLAGAGSRPRRGGRRLLRGVGRRRCWLGGLQELQLCFEGGEFVFQLLVGGGRRRCWLGGLQTLYLGFGGGELSFQLIDLEAEVGVGCFDGGELSFHCLDGGGVLSFQFIDDGGVLSPQFIDGGRGISFQFVVLEAQTGVCSLEDRILETEDIVLAFATHWEGVHCVEVVGGSCDCGWEL